MFQYYQILLAVNIPSPVLTYKILLNQDTSTESFELLQGQLVEVPVRGRTVYGIVLETLDPNNISYDIDKVQLITTTYSYVLPETSLKLIRIFNLATFNNAGLILETILNPFLNLADKHRNSILEYHQQKNLKDKANKLDKNQEKPSITVLGNYDFDISIPSRIMYLIRIGNQVSEPTLTQSLDLASFSNSNILIVCPEVKMLTVLYNDIKELITPQDKIDLLQFTSNINQNNRKLIIDVMSQWGLNIIPNSNKRVILTTRAGLFLPFDKLDKIILVDEANSNYYQASNSLYYDTRELVLWIQRAYQCSVDFVSNFPSIRLRSFDDKTSIESNLSKVSETLSKSIHIELSHYNSKMTQNRIFGPQIEAILNDEIGNMME